jgi:NAD(P)-dependent dehydrogenase (short-subunit alcohol dehydrogenase family)
MGNVALVTGAPAGLGAAISIALTEAGADVACHGNRRAPDATCETIAGLGGRSVAVSGDLIDPEVPRKLYEKIVNIASILSFQGGLTVPAYSASKGGVAILTKALANQWARWASM